jgi:hypothetical protein
MSETFEEQEEWTEDSGPEEAAEGEGDAASGGQRAAREANYATMANRNLQRARKSVMTKGGDSDGDEAAQAHFLTQSATVYAILELADAVRNQGK